MLRRTIGGLLLRRLPPLGSIQAFVHVARLGSVKAAADSLALSSPALSRRIQSLEQIVGEPLLHRQNNSVRLNARGLRLLAEIEPYLDGLANAFDRLAQESGSMRLRIAVPSLFASQRLMGALPSLRERHPDLTIDVDTGANRVSRLDNGIDAAIAVAESLDERYYSRMIEGSRIVAIGSPRLLESDRPIRGIEDLSNAHILLHRGLPRAFERWRNAVGMPDLEAAGTSYYDAGQLILDAAAQGLGIAFMLESHLPAAERAGLRQFFDETAASPYAYWFVCMPGALGRRPVKLFHDWLFEHFSEEAKLVRARAA